MNGSTITPIIYYLLIYLVVFSRKWQSWVIVTKIVWLTKTKVFAVCSSLYRKKKLPIPGLDHRGLCVRGLRRTYIDSWNFRTALFYINLHGVPFCKKNYTFSSMLLYSPFMDQLLIVDYYLWKYQFVHSFTPQHFMVQLSRNKWLTKK